MVELPPSMSADSLTEPSVPRPGDRIGDRYVVEWTVATGGMGVIVAARHELLEERFAIKLLQPDMLDASDVVHRFLREAQACVGLRGEHTVRVFDVGRLPSGLPFMVMELLRGRDLRRELEERGALPADEAATWVLQACQGLAEAHARGVVHRDIKPSNLFLAEQPDGRRIVKIVDFGISKILDEVPSSQNPELTLSGMLGSPQYMSPEQVRSASNVDHRTDIWSLGCVLFELLAGTPPFSGESVSAVSAMIAADDPTPLERLRPGLPVPIVHAVTRCLAKNRDERIQTVAELAELLESFATEAPVASERVARILRSSQPSISARPQGTPTIDVSETISSERVDGVGSGTERSAPSNHSQPRTRPRRTRGVILAALCAIAFGVAAWLVARREASDEHVAASQAAEVGRSSASQLASAHLPDFAPELTPPMVASSAPAPTSSGRPTGALPKLTRGGREMAAQAVSTPAPVPQKPVDEVLSDRQ